MATAHQFPQPDPRAAYNAMLARDAERKADLAAFIAEHDDVLSGEIVHRGAAGAEYHLTVNAGEWITTGIGWTLEAARLSAFDTHDGEVLGLAAFARELLA